MTTRYELEVISPLHVGSGDQLTRFDYVWDNRQLHVVDLDKLLHQPRVSAAALTDWLESPNFDMSRYVLETLRLSPNVIAKYSVDCTANPRGVSVSQQIKTAWGDCYVPGSSLKGAIRTALAWAMLDHGVYQPRERDLGRSRNWAARSLEAELFGSDPNHDVMRALQVGDSMPLPASSLVGTNSTVYTLSRGSTLNPKAGGRYELWVEALPEKTQMEGKWHLDAGLLQERVARRLGFVLKRVWLGDVPRHARKFAAALIEHESAFYQQYGPPQLREFYRRLQNRHEKLADNEFLVQMSWGTGWHSKTVGLTLANGLLEEARRRHRLGKRNAPFPKTRRLIVRGNTPEAPFGWVLIRLPDFAPADFAADLPPARHPTPSQTRTPAGSGELTGRVKWFNANKGYGFIAPDDGGGDLFVHISQVEGGMELRDGQRVTFVIGEGRRGPQAQSVRGI